MSCECDFGTKKYGNVPVPNAARVGDVMPRGVVIDGQDLNNGIEVLPEALSDNDAQE